MELWLEHDADVEYVGLARFLPGGPAVNGPRNAAPASRESGLAVWS